MTGHEHCPLAIRTRPVGTDYRREAELCDRLGVIGAVDAAVGPIKQRDRGFGAGELPAGIAAAQMAGEDFLVGLDQQRVDAAGQQIAPAPGLSSTTAAGLARRITPGQWRRPWRPAPAAPLGARVCPPSRMKYADRRSDSRKRRRFAESQATQE